MTKRGGVDGCLLTLDLVCRDWPTPPGPPIPTALEPGPYWDHAASHKLNPVIAKWVWFR